MKKRWVVLLIVIAVAVTAFSLGGVPLIQFLMDQQRVQAWITGFGLWAPLVLIGTRVLPMVLGISSFSLLPIVGACVFGFWAGFLYSAVGLTLGTAINIVLARRFGRPLVDRLIDPKYMARFDRFTGERSILFYVIVFVIPWMPKDLICYAVGLSRAALKVMIPVAALGRLPSVAVQAEPYASVLAIYGYPAATITNALQVLDAYSKADTDQNSAVGDAVKATADRNAAVKALDAYMKQIKGIARVALRQRPDLLKKLNG